MDILMPLILTQVRYVRTNIEHLEVCREDLDLTLYRTVECVGKFNNSALMAER